MSDLIDRHAAIDALCSECQGGCVPCDSFPCGEVQAIQSLPSAQPDLDEWCDTCREYDSERHCCPRYNRVIREAVEEVKEERIYCKDCKHRYTDDCSMRFTGEVWYKDTGDEDDEYAYEDFDEIVTDNTTDDGFCNYGKRKEEHD